MKHTDKKHEGIKKALLTGFISAVTAQAVKPVVEHGIEIIKTKTLYSISINNMICAIGGALKELFPNFPNVVEFFNGESQYIVDSPVRYTAMSWNFHENYVDLTMFEGCPIMLKINKFARSDHMIDSDGAYLITLNTPYCRKAMEHFVRKLYDMSIQQRISEFRNRYYDVRKVCMDRNGETDSNWLEHRLRTFDDVFIPVEQKNALIEAIDAYVNNHAFYVKNNLPNHFGVLLYGVGGTGKSSIAQAIASHVGAEMMVASGDCIKHIEKIIRMMGQHSVDDSIYRVLLFEDIDSGLFNLTRETHNKEDDKDDNVGMATILNALDGIGAPTNIIYVFTTNHVEALDPAFIRPGRCDLHMEIKGVTKETLTEFLKFHYPDTFEGFLNWYEVKDGLTFAELQTLVMKGDSASDIIKFARKED